MNAKEIREKNASYGDGLKEAGNVDNGEFIIKAADLEMLVEVAAQLAEVKEFLKIYSNPPMVFKGTDIDPSSLDDALQNLPQGILTVMEPRLTLRDQFAMAALQGMLASVDPQASVSVNHNTAKEAYLWADELMEARK
jgi:hypothetical protein